MLLFTAAVNFPRMTGPYSVLSYANLSVAVNSNHILSIIRSLSIFLRLIKDLRRILHKVNNFQVLGAVALTLAAGDAVRGFSESAGQISVIEPGVGLLPKLLQLVVERKILGKRNVLRTSVHTVAAASTL